MNSQPTPGSASERCPACEGAVEKYTTEHAQARLHSLPGWRLTHDGLRIRRDWEVRNFQAGIDFLAKVAELAEQLGHHPDLHLEGYRRVWIEIWTHAIGGLCEYDFILAAQIDQLPVRLSKKAASAPP